MDVRFLGYEGRDREVIDYHMTSLPGTRFSVRGPLPLSLEPGSYFAAVGAAQTFGCYCEQPFHAILGRRIGLPALNLGMAGAGPEFFAAQEGMIEYINRARFAVLQVMSARSQSNSLYECGGLEYVTLRADGRKLGAEEAFEELIGKVPTKGSSLAERAARKARNLRARPRVRSLTREIRANWTASNLRLLDRIEVPTVLFWFSQRGPAYQEDYTSTWKLLGLFPQLVTPEMLAPIIPRAAAYVECISARGMPQKLFSRFTGEPVTTPPFENAYYPSPEMQEDAANALEEVCRKLAAESGAGEFSSSR